MWELISNSKSVGSSDCFTLSMTLKGLWNLLSSLFRNLYFLIVSDLKQHRECGYKVYKALAFLLVILDWSCSQGTGVSKWVVILTGGIFYLFSKNKSMMSFLTNDSSQNIFTSLPNKVKINPNKKIVAEIKAIEFNCILKSTTITKQCIITTFLQLLLIVQKKKNVCNWKNLVLKLTP